MSNIRKTIAYFKRNGIANTYYAAKERLLETKGVPYSFSIPSEAVLTQQREASKNPPIVLSILVPVYETPEEYLRELVDSVLDQTYPGWELILADASASDNPRNVIESYSDERIKYVKLNSNGGISANTNAGLEKATGEYTALLDHDDLLTPDALFEVVAAVLKGRANGRNPVFIYSDEDKCDGEGKIFYEPNVKPEFNLDYLLSNNYICHLSVINTEILRKYGFRLEYDGAQDHDLFIRICGDLCKNGEEKKIAHISRVLYHWRCHEMSTAQNPASKDYAYEAGRRAIEDYIGCKTVHTLHKGFFHIEYNEKLFEERPDIGAVGGFMTSGNKITGGIYDKDGKCPYENMNKHFSGELHRAHCTMDVYALDILDLSPNPALSHLYAESLYGYQNDLEKIKSETKRSFGELSTQEKRNIRWKWNKYFAEEAGKLGYRMLFDPKYRRGMEYSGCVFDERIPVTVVIPNYNGLDYLKACLESIKNCNPKPSEIIVVDNGSSDGSVEFLKADYPGVNVIMHKDNLGFTGAVNHGITAAHYPYIFLLNNDTTLEKECIGKLYDAMKDDPGIFSAGALMLSMDNPETVDNAGDSYNLFGYARSFASGKSRFNMKVDKPARVFTACAGAAMYRKNILCKIGLFDDRHFAYLEDVDIGYRARIYGYRNINVRGAVVFHKGSAVSGSKHNAFKVGLSSRNSVMVAMKNQPLLQFLFNLPFILAGIVIKTLFFMTKGLGKEYIAGTLRGFRLSLSREGLKHHVNWRPAFVWNYIKIQFYIIKATFMF